MNKYLIIEIGTNTTKSLRAQYNDGTWQNIEDSIYASRLGENLSVTGILSKDVIKRNLDIIKSILLEYSNESGVITHIIATESVRKAANAEEFIRQVYDCCNIKIEVLTGEEEAMLAYRGATYHSLSDDRLTEVVDIGGGSTELTIGFGDKIVSTQSLPIGAVKLTEFCIHHDPPSTCDIEMMQSIINDRIKMIAPGNSMIKLIGVGGTITTLAALNSAGKQDTVADVEQIILLLQDVQKMINLISPMNLKEKKALPNMPEGRADIILAGAVLLEMLMQKLRQSELIVSVRGVRHGYLFTYIKP